jgi:uncharacterized membrane protein
MRLLGLIAWARRWRPFVWRWSSLTTVSPTSTTGAGHVTAHREYISYWENWKDPGSPPGVGAREPSLVDLGRLAQIAQRMKGKAVQVVGFTDAIGSQPST